MAKAKRVAWDACVWIATIIQENAPLKGGGFEDRAPACNYIIEQATRGQIEIATSALSLAEVCKIDEVKAQGEDVLSDFFRNDYILVVNVDRYVGSLARKLLQSGYPGLKPPDSIHLATALIADVTELHTYDKKLLNLNGKLQKPAGGVLKICKPPAPPANLFTALGEASTRTSLSDPGFRLLP